MNAGDWFQIMHKKHFAFGERHQAVKVQREKIKGNEGEAILDLGTMIEFVIEDYYGRPCRHAVPIEWCAACERPNLSRRVKKAAIPEGETPEFWNDLHATCREKAAGK